MDCLAVESEYVSLFHPYSLLKEEVIKQLLHYMILIF